MQIDPRTLLIVFTLSTLFLAFFLVFYRFTRETYPGFRMWVYATVIMALGAHLLAFRGVVPVGLSIMAGNIAFPVGGVCLLQGTKRFLKLPAPRKAIWAIPLLTLLGLGFFYWVHDIAAVRGVVMSFGTASVYLLTAWLLCRHAPSDNKALYYFTSFMLTIANVALLVRSILWLLFVPEARLFTHNVSQTVYLLIAIFSQIGWTFGFVMMNGQRMEDDLRESRAELSGANNDLAMALKEVKQLSGLLPICSHCKQIRDDKGYWQRIESYIGAHSEAEFTHSICPDCAKKFYPELDFYPETK
jgi:hypothetical protein